MAKRIKILFTIPNFDTAGSGKVVYDLVKGLDRTIFEPELCCFHNRGEFFKTMETLGVKIHIFPFASPYRPFWSLPYRIFKIYRFFKTHHFDLIHSWHWSSDITEPLAAKLAGIPFVYTKKAMGWGNKAWRWRTQLSTKVIAINTDMVHTFLKPYHKKVVYMPLGVDVAYFKPQKPSEALQHELGIKPTDFVIISVANLVPVKGIEVFLEAVKLLQEPSIKVLIVGDYQNAYGNGLKSKYESANFQFLGKQQDVRPYMALANLFVIPTLDSGRKEGLPIAPLEAMAMGVVVIGSRVSGVNDVLKAFDDYLFRPSDIDMLAEKINALYGINDNERAALGKAMRDAVRSDYDLKQCIFGHEHLYKLIV